MPGRWLPRFFILRGRLFREFDTFGRASAIYANYRTAVMERGLSPEQRRLLFGYAVAGLAQALPYGEPMPRSNAKYPLLR